MHSKKRWGLLTLAIVLLACGYSQAGIGDSSGQYRNIELIASNQPGFPAAIDTDFPELRQVDGFEVIKPFVAILHNNSGHGIKAYVVTWNITGLNGQGKERRVVSWLRGGLGYPSGESIVWKAGEARIVSPRFNWNESGMQARDVSRVFNALVKGPLAKEVNNTVRVDTSLDAVVYDDGVCAGPDKSSFCDQYVNGRNAELDEAFAILGLLNRNLPDDRIATRLNNDIAKDRTAEGNDVSSFLETARGREARILLSVFERQGRTRLWETAQHLAAYPKTVLQRR